MKAFAFLFSLLLSHPCISNADCSVTDDEPDPNVKEMRYDIGHGEQTFMAYVEPDIKTFYKGETPAGTKVVPKFNGLSVKFINMSNRRVRLSW